LIRIKDPRRGAAETGRPTSHGSRMNHHHRKVLHALFAHPVSANIDPKHVLSVLEELGAEVAPGGHGQVKVTLNGRTRGFHDTRHSLSRDEVGALRHFLVEAGVDPERDYPL
jgi:hypothetical protein